MDPNPTLLHLYSYHPLQDSKCPAEECIPLYNPATNELIGLVPQSTPSELKEAEEGAQAAFKKWKEVPVQQRQRVMFKFQALIREHTEDLAASITKEQGKTLPDARGDVFRGLEVVEATCHVGGSLMGETQENVSKGMDCYSYRQPLGVTAGICPFNFPAMIPLWMMSISPACGNAIVLKPSEKDPGDLLITFLIFPYISSQTHILLIFCLIPPLLWLLCL